MRQFSSPPSTRDNLRHKRLHLPFPLDRLWQGHVQSRGDDRSSLSRRFVNASRTGQNEKTEHFPKAHQDGLGTNPILLVQRLHEQTSNWQQRLQLMGNVEIDERRD